MNQVATAIRNTDNLELAITFDVRSRPALLPELFNSTFSFPSDINNIVTKLLVNDDDDTVFHMHDEVPATNETTAIPATPIYFLRDDILNKVKNTINDAFIETAFRTFENEDDDDERERLFETHFTQLWRGMTVSFQLGQRIIHVRNTTDHRRSLARALDNLWTTSEQLDVFAPPPALQLTIHLNSVYLTVNKNQLDPYNLEYITTDPNLQYVEPAPVPPTPPTPQSSSPNAAASATAQAAASATAQAAASAAAQAQADALSRLSIAIQDSNDLNRERDRARILGDAVHDTGYVSSNIPTLVRQRMNIHNDDTVILTDAAIKPFHYIRALPSKTSNGKAIMKKKLGFWKCWEEGLYHLVSLDGRLWHLLSKASDRAYEPFVNDFPKLQDPSDGSVVRRWYEDVTVHCQGFNIYIQPYALLDPTINDDKGFTCGNGPTDDIPGRFDTRIPFWSGTIARGLIKANPKEFGSLIRKRNGYAAAVNMVKTYHHKFVDSPILLVKDYPVQTPTMSTQKYFDKWMDHNTIDGLISNHTASLADKDQQDLFVSNHQHSDYLRPLIAVDRRDPSKADDFLLSNFPNTIERYLQNLPEHKKRATRGRFLKNPYATVNQVNAADVDNDDDSNNDDDSISLLETPSDSIITEEFLNLVLNAIVKDSTNATKRPCIACKVTNPEDTDHPFIRCKYLNNLRHCRGVYIEIMKAINAILKQQAKFNEDEQKAAVNALKAHLAERAKQDFQEGNNDD